jgi:hypothetical protein
MGRDGIQSHCTQLSKPTNSTTTYQQHSPTPTPTSTSTSAQLVSNRMPLLVYEGEEVLKDKQMLKSQ